MDGERETESDSDVELVPKKNSTSVVWNYFGFSTTDTDQTNIICKLCKEEHLKTKDGNTTGLRNHLKRKHTREHADTLSLQGPPRVKQAKTKQPKQTTITQAGLLGAAAGALQDGGVLLQPVCHRPVRGEG